MAYEWSGEKMACVATYKILEGEEFLDQFEDANVPFESAAQLEMRRLRYYPGTTVNASILKLLSIQMAQRFYVDVAKTYTVARQRPERFVSQTIDSLAGIFKRSNGKMIELAEIIDDDLRFPGEAA
jgi:hypothetical protein